MNLYYVGAIWLEPSATGSIKGTRGPFVPGLKPALPTHSSSRTRGINVYLHLLFLPFSSASFYLGLFSLCWRKPFSISSHKGQLLMLPVCVCLIQEENFVWMQTDVCYHDWEGLTYVWVDSHRDSSRMEVEFEEIRPKKSLNLIKDIEFTYSQRSANLLAG